VLTRKDRAKSTTWVRAQALGVKPEDDDGRHDRESSFPLFGITRAAAKRLRWPSAHRVRTRDLWSHSSGGCRPAPRVSGREIARAPGSRGGKRNV